MDFLKESISDLIINISDAEITYILCTFYPGPQ